jgi:hypothetical protein
VLVGDSYGLEPFPKVGATLPQNSPLGEWR